MRAPRLLAAVVTAALAGLAPVSAAPTPGPRPDEADEQYQLIAGLVERGLHEVAVKEARRFLESHADHPKAALARYRLASSLFDLDRIDEAAVEFASLSSRSGFQFEPEVHFRLGQCELYRGRAAEAAAALERALELDRDYLNEPARFFLGEARFRLEDFERAEQSYLAVLAQGGGGEYERDAAFGLAWCAFRLGRFDDAVRRIEGFLASHADDPGGDELRFLLGESHLASGRPAEALAAYGSVRGGAYAESALRGAAFAHAALGRHGEAAQAFDDLLERFPEGAHRQEAVLHGGIEWLRADRADRALRVLGDPALSADPEALYWRAQAELKTGAAEAGLATIDAALALDPGGELRERLQVSRGDALFDLGRGQEAVGAYRQSESEYALYAASIAALNEGRVSEAVELARRVLETFPETGYHAELQLVLGEGALAEERYERAETAFLAALAGEGSQAAAPRALSRAGWCRFLAGELAGAAELFERVAAEYPVAPECEEALFMQGKCHEALGAADRAAGAWKRYLESYPGGPRRGEVLIGLARVDAEGSVDWLQATLAEGGDPARSAFALFELAERAAAAGERGAAIDRYRALLERFPEDPNVPAARYGLAWCLFEEGRFADAAAALEPFAGADAFDEQLRLSALELAVWARSKQGDPAAARAAWAGFQAACQDERRLWDAARTTLASLQAAGDLDGARALLDGLLPELSDGELTLAVLVEGAWLALDRGRVDEAEAAVRTALKLAERRDLDGGEALAEACFFVGEARFEAGAHEAAAAQYAEAAARGSAELEARALYKLGFARLGLEDWPAAAAAFGAFVEGHADHELAGECLYLLGEARFRAGQFDQAVQPLERLRSERPEHASVPKALFRLGLALGELERWKESEAALAELLRREPGFELAAEADLWRGRALSALGERRGARAAFDRVVAKDKTVLAARARIGIGRLALEAGESEDALAEFLKVALLFADPEEVAQALYLAGMALEQMGDVERARAQYRELAEEHAGTPSAALARKRLRELGS